MLYESEPIQFRHAVRLWNQTEIGTSDTYQGRGITFNQGLVMAQVWIYTEIGHSQRREDYGRGFIN